MTPEQVVDVIKRFRFERKRGGGFPTGLKWEFAMNRMQTRNMFAVMPTRETGSIHGQKCP